MLYPLMEQKIQECRAAHFTEEIFRWTATLVDHGVMTEVKSRKVPLAVCCRCEDREKKVGVGSNVEMVTNLFRLWFSFDMWWKILDLQWVVEVLLLTVGKNSYTFDFRDVVAAVMDPNESSAVLRCVRSWFSHEGQSSCAEMTAAVVRASQEAMSQRERLLGSSGVSPWLQVCVGNSETFGEEYISKWLGHGSPLRASPPDTFTSAPMASLSPKQKKEWRKCQTGRRSRGVSSKLRKPMKEPRFPADVLVPGPSRGVSEEVVVGSRARRVFRLESSDGEQGGRQGLDWL